MPPPPTSPPPIPAFLLPPERVTFDTPPPALSTTTATSTTNRQWATAARRRASRLNQQMDEAMNETRERLRALRRRFDAQLEANDAAEIIEESNVRRRRRRPFVEDGQPESSSSSSPNTRRFLPPPIRRREYIRNEANRIRGEMENTTGTRRPGIFQVPSLPHTDTEVDTRQSKKRKLTHEVTPFQPHQYGWKGQVETAHLKLEIASYDGGYWSSDDKYRVENLLKKDNNVYCSNSASCHILFQHQAGTTFHLDRLVVKAPRNDYTAPYVYILPFTPFHHLLNLSPSRVQRGLVFVGMNPEQLIKAAESYKVNTYTDRYSTRTPYSVYQSAINHHTRDYSPMSLTDEDEPNPEPRALSPTLLPVYMGRRVPRNVSPQPIIESDNSDSDDEAETNWFPAVPDLHDHSNPIIPEIPPARLRRIATLQDLLQQIHSYGSRDEPYATLRRDLEQEMSALYESPVQPETDSDVLEPDANFFIPRPKSKIVIKFDAPL